VADVEQADGQLVMPSYACPLSSVVVAHPELCDLAEALLSELLGAPVEQRCDRDVPPRCRFAIST
jgi:predicted ArsR family transcriptional regulator